VFIAWGGEMPFEAMMLEILVGQSVIGIEVLIPPDLRQKIFNCGKLSDCLVPIEGSSTSPDTPAQVKELLGGSGEVLIVLDSNHSHEHVLNELRAYAPLVEKEQYIICRDAIVEYMPPQTHVLRPWGLGNNPATTVSEFLMRMIIF
jgi:cephalosporin hydroxylase